VTVHIQRPVLQAGHGGLETWTTGATARDMSHRRRETGDTLWMKSVLSRAWKTSPESETTAEEAVRSTWPRSSSLPPVGVSGPVFDKGEAGIFGLPHFKTLDANDALA
jgi:hypothetical protein